MKAIGGTSGIGQIRKQVTVITHSCMIQCEFRKKSMLKTVNKPSSGTEIVIHAFIRKNRNLPVISLLRRFRNFLCSRCKTRRRIHESRMAPRIAAERKHPCTLPDRQRRRQIPCLNSRIFLKSIGRPDAVLIQSLDADVAVFSSVVLFLQMILSMQPD